MFVFNVWVLDCNLSVLFFYRVATSCCKHVNKCLDGNIIYMLICGAEKSQLMRKKKKKMQINL